MVGEYLFSPLRGNSDIYMEKERCALLRMRKLRFEEPSRNFVISLLDVAIYRRSALIQEKMTETPD